MAFSSLGILLFIATIHQQYAIKIKNLCDDQPYGTLLPNPRNCSSYYICQIGPELAYCDHGLHFDNTYKVCNWPSSTSCVIQEVEADEDDSDVQRQVETEHQEQIQEVDNTIVIESIYNSANTVAPAIELESAYSVDLDGVDSTSDISTDLLLKNIVEKDQPTNDDSNGEHTCSEICYHPPANSGDVAPSISEDIHVQVTEGAISGNEASEISPQKSTPASTNPPSSFIEKDVPLHPSDATYQETNVNSLTDFTDPPTPEEFQTETETSTSNAENKSPESNQYTTSNPFSPDVDNAVFYETTSDKDNFHTVDVQSEDDKSSKDQSIDRPVLNSPSEHVDSNYNLATSIVSVESDQAVVVIDRPIIGAHDIQTGYLVDSMIGYNSCNIQCIHNGFYFLPHPTDCTQYYICAYHRLHLHSCGDTLVWNFQKEQCTNEPVSWCFTNVAPESLPESQQPTHAPKVEEFSTVTTTTNTKTSWNPMPPIRTTQSTVPTPPLDHRRKEPVCPSLRQSYLPSFEDCNKYYICILGHPVLTSCPESMHWDEMNEFCAHPSVVVCAQE